MGCWRPARRAANHRSEPGQLPEDDADPLVGRRLQHRRDPAGRRCPGVARDSAPPCICRGPDVGKHGHRGNQRASTAARQTLDRPRHTGAGNAGRRPACPHGERASVEKGGTLLGVRSVAALLLVSLIGPSITSAVCDLACVQHEHHATQAASAQSCHEQRSSHDGPAVTSGTPDSCHDQVEAFTTTAADPRLLNATPVTVQLPSALAVYHPHIRVVDRSMSFGSPGIVLQTTPLRI